MDPQRAGCHFSSRCGRKCDGDRPGTGRRRLASPSLFSGLSGMRAGVSVNVETGARRSWPGLAYPRWLGTSEIQRSVPKRKRGSLVGGVRTETIRQSFGERHGVRVLRRQSQAVKLLSSKPHRPARPSFASEFRAVENATCHAGPCFCLQDGVPGDRLIAPRPRLVGRSLGAAGREWCEEGNWDSRNSQPVALTSRPITNGVPEMKQAWVLCWRRADARSHSRSLCPDSVSHVERLLSRSLSGAGIRPCWCFHASVRRRRLLLMKMQSGRGWPRFGFSLFFLLNFVSCFWRPKPKTQLPSRSVSGAPRQPIRRSSPATAFCPTHQAQPHQPQHQQEYLLAVA